MRSASWNLALALAASFVLGAGCGLEPEPGVIYGVSAKGDDNRAPATAAVPAEAEQSPFSPDACAGEPTYPGAAQARFTLEIRRRSCSAPACTSWEQVDLDWPLGAMEGTIETVQVPYYRTESDYGYHFCCGLRFDAFSGEYKTDCGWGFCTETRSVLAGHHPGLVIRNSLDNRCKPWWRLWGGAEPRPQELACTFVDRSLECDAYSYADGCDDREPKLGKSKIRFSEGTVTARCARLVARHTVPTGREGTVEEYQIGILARF